jgi:hypothetical protein
MALWSKTKASTMEDLARQAQMDMELQIAQQKMSMAQQAMMNNAQIANNSGLQNAYQKAYKNALLGGQGQAMLPSGTGISQQSMGQIYTSSTTTAWKDPTPRFDPNKNAATKMPLSTLVDLWRAKYGDTWVNCTTPIEEGDDFWPAGSARLERNNKLEVYEDGNTWLRIKEDA